METRLLYSGLSKLSLNLLFCWKTAVGRDLEGRGLEGISKISSNYYMWKMNFLYVLLSSAFSHTQQPSVTPYFHKFQMQKPLPFKTLFNPATVFLPYLGSLPLLSLNVSHPSSLV